jgi:hypothetical protein
MMIIAGAGLGQLRHVRDFYFGWGAFPTRRTFHEAITLTTTGNPITGLPVQS